MNLDGVGLIPAHPSIRWGEKHTKQLHILLLLFVPEHYDLFLDLNRADKTLREEVTITGEAKAENFLTQKDLTIEAVEVAGTSSSLHSW